MKTIDPNDQKDFTVVIECRVNPSRDADLDNPEIKSYWYEVKADTENEAKDIAKKLFDVEEPYKGIWCIDVM